MRWLRAIAGQLGLDRGVAMTLLARGWSVVAGLLTIWAIGRFLTPELQGYYFTFASLISLQVVVELGLGYAIVQFASHEMGALSWSIDGRVQGSAAARRRLQSLLRFALAWFSAAGALMAATFVPLGSAFLAAEGLQAGVTPHAIHAWTWLVPLTAVNLLVSAATAMLEGCGQVASVATGRLLQAVLGSAALWAGLATESGLFALVAQSAVTLVAGLAWLLVTHRGFLRDLLAPPDHLPGIDWRREIWPFQWRIAVSWGSGYLIGQLFSPLLFATHGPVVAGQMGLSLQICSALNILALAWISAQVPTYGRLLARSEDAALERLFVRSLLQSGAVLLALLLVLLGGLALLAQLDPALARRVVPLPMLACMAVVTLANHVVWAQAALLRARREDPFMVISVCQGLATAALAYLLVPSYGLWGAVATYTLTTVGVSLLGGTAIFLRQRKAGWSAPAQSPLPSCGSSS